MDAAEYALVDDARAVHMEGQAAHAQGNMGRVQESMVRAFNGNNGDGQVGRDEFISNTADWLALIDRHASGDVTAKDFRHSI